MTCVCKDGISRLNTIRLSILNGFMAGFALNHFLSSPSSHEDGVLTHKTSYKSSFAQEVTKFQNRSMDFEIRHFTDFKMCHRFQKISMIPH